MCASHDINKKNYVVRKNFICNKVYDIITVCTRMLFIQYSIGNHNKIICGTNVQGTSATVIIAFTLLAKLVNTKLLKPIRKK